MIPTDQLVASLPTNTTSFAPSGFPWDCSIAWDCTSTPIPKPKLTDNEHNAKVLLNWNNYRKSPDFHKIEETLPTGALVRNDFQFAVHGGCIRDIQWNTEPTDYDIMFADHSHISTFVNMLANKKILRDASKYELQKNCGRFDLIPIDYGIKVSINFKSPTTKKHSHLILDLCSRDHPDHTLEDSNIKDSNNIKLIKSVDYTINALYIDQEKQLRSKSAIYDVDTILRHIAEKKLVKVDPIEEHKAFILKNYYNKRSHTHTPDKVNYPDCDNFFAKCHLLCIRETLQEYCEQMLQTHLASVSKKSNKSKKISIYDFDPRKEKGRVTCEHNKIRLKYYFELFENPTYESIASLYDALSLRDEKMAKKVADITDAEPA